MNENGNLYSKMFMWLFVGLFVSFILGYSLTLNEELLSLLLGIGLLPIIIVELVVAFVLALAIRKLSTTMTKVLYITYSVLTGLTLSLIFIAYELSSVISVFMTTSIIFVLMAMYGYHTKKDLTKIGTILFIALLGMIIGGFLNLLIFKSSMMDLVISSIGVLVFTIYIAYDVNKIKYMLTDIDEEKRAVYGAFQLYLDFINLFYSLLRIFGNSRN